MRSALNLGGADAGLPYRVESRHEMAPNMQNLPGCVKVVAHLVIFCFQFVALPFALVVAASEAVLCWPVFRAAVDVAADDAREMQLLHWRLVWHALCWPVRLAIAVALIPALLAPLAGAGVAVWWATGESVLAGIAGGLFTLFVAVAGGHCIVERIGVFSCLPRMSPPKKKDMLTGCGYALVDAVSFLCLLCVLGTVVRWLGFGGAVHKRWTSGKQYKGRGLRRELVVQASLSVLDLLCVPLLLLIHLTVLRAPRLHRSWALHFAGSSSKGNLGKANSWKARMIVLRQALCLVVIDLPTVVATFLVSATVFRLPALCHAWGARLDLTAEAAVGIGAEWREAEDEVNFAKKRSLWLTLAEGELSLHGIIWTQLVLVIVDIVCAPFIFLAFISGVRASRVLRKWRTRREERKKARQKERFETAEAYRQLNGDTLRMRGSAVVECVYLIIVDLPTVLALALLCATVRTQAPRPHNMISRDGF